MSPARFCGLLLYLRKTHTPHLVLEVVVRNARVPDITWGAGLRGDLSHRLAQTQDRRMGRAMRFAQVKEEGPQGPGDTEQNA